MIITWARPEWLMLLALTLLFPLVGWVSARLRRRRVARWGIANPDKPRFRGLVEAMFLAGWVMAIIGLAGPRWGTMLEADRLYGRDVVIILDLSRSMLAADMLPDAQGAVTRWEVARNGIRDLANAAQRRGGHRLAVIVFAARAKVWIPLTHDYDHVRRMIDELDARYPPPEILLNPAAGESGTRIGAAITLATQLIDPRFPRATDLLILSDGDDPVLDQEWQRGVTAASNAGVPIHTIGLGDPQQGSTIATGPNELLEFRDVPIVTKLMPEPLEQLARQTGGVAWMTERTPPLLGDWFRSELEPRTERELDADALPQPAPRQTWFYLAALLAWTVSFYLERAYANPGLGRRGADGGQR